MINLLKIGQKFILENSRYYFSLLLITLFYGIAFTYTDFHSNPFHDLADFTVIVLQWLTVSFATFGLLYLLSLNRFIFAITFPLLTTLCAVLAYFRLTANFSLTPMALDAALDNDIRTSLELITPSLLLFVLLCLTLSILFIAKVYTRIKPTFVALHLIFSISILLITNYFYSSLRRPIAERIPFTIYYTSEKYLTEKASIASHRMQLNQGASCKLDSVTVVLVLGEALRPDHLSINGYKRNTTPFLSKENVISFPNIYSEYTYTNRSLPHILTRADSVFTERAYNEASFINIFNACNYHSTWLSNQESALPYAYFMHEAKELYFANLSKSVYNYDKWLDGDLLPHFEKAVQNKAAKKLIVMHTIGSHWWYNAHFPESFCKYKPIIKSKIISSCTKEEMTNSYDNTILYTDFVLKQAIDKLKDKNAILIYLSDHGEALGEEEKWLHAHDTPAIHSTACFVWMSEAYKKQHPSKFAAIQANNKKRWRTDFLFHSILAAGDIQSPYRVESLNIFSTK